MTCAYPLAQKYLRLLSPRSHRSEALNCNGILRRRALAMRSSSLAPVNGLVAMAPGRAAVARMPSEARGRDNPGSLFLACFYNPIQL